MTTRRQTPESAKRKNRRVQKKKVPIVHPDISIAEIVSLHEDAASILATYGLHCVGCAYNELETLREGAEAHGLTEDDLSNVIEDLTELILSTPKRPATLTITEAAAHALLAIAETEGKKGWFLRVTSDETGGFCMEFEEEAKTDDRSFSASDVPALVLIAAPETLARIGGATIDHREGRFKLDLIQKATCACSEKDCSCKKQ